MPTVRHLATLPSPALPDAMASPKPPPPQLDAATLAHVERVLIDRLAAIETYGAPGGCRACHEGELRGAIRTVREMRARVAPSDRQP